MTGNDDRRGGDADLDDVIETEPQSKQGRGGQATKDGDTIGPNSADAGKTQAPQKGDPKADDRRPH